MSHLSKVLIFKIFGTVFVWCIPLLLFPASVLELFGLPSQESYMFIRMLGWAYLALCVGYFMGLKASLKDKRLMTPIYVGLVSNGGACLFLLYYGISGEWLNWGAAIQFIAWGSTLATALITFGLFLFGIRGKQPAVESF